MLLGLMLINVNPKHQLLHGIESMLIGELCVPLTAFIDKCLDFNHFMVITLNPKNEDETLYLPVLFNVAGFADVVQKKRKHAISLRLQ